MKKSFHHSLVAGAAIAACVVAGCAVGPDYKRPKTETPATYRTAATDTNSLTGTNTFADLGWWEVYDDPQLRAYIQEALTNSWDIKIAAARILEAEASLSISRSQLFPTITANGDWQTTRTSEKGPNHIPGVNPVQHYTDAFLSMPGYEVDLWGRIRRANEASRAELLATVAAQRSVRQTLVAQVATTYLQLVELDRELEIDRSTYSIRTNSLELTRSREQGGVAGMNDVYQAETLVYTAEAAIVNTSKLIEQTEDQMSILLGRNPGKIERNVSLMDQKLWMDLPAGLPSSLLQRRPDIQSAEEQLTAANANIGQARAAFFPQLTLTGFYGFQSVALSDLFTAPARTWQFGPSVTLPLFTGGRLRGQQKLAEANFAESLAAYQQTVQNAFSEVSDSLIAYQRTREFYDRQTLLTEANVNAAELASIRYEGGVTSYLEVLFNEQQLFDAQLALAQARLSELLSVVQLYQALGGGWEAPALPAAANAKN